MLPEAIHCPHHSISLHTTKTKSTDSQCSGIWLTFAQERMVTFILALKQGHHTIEVVLSPCVHKKKENSRIVVKIHIRWFFWTKITNKTYNDLSFLQTNSKFQKLFMPNSFYVIRGCSIILLSFSMLQIIVNCMCCWQFLLTTSPNVHQTF